MRMRREQNVTRTRNSKRLDTKTSNSTHDATQNSTMQKRSGNSKKAQTVWDTDELI
uniref:Uncharacterized protein n=1 Tax=Aegilops tauschii subsp. strangulata TaxID=200361 RepID=A0A453HYI6_AEGTS